MAIRVDEDYREERECLYDGRLYRVRDNGAVMRLSESGKRKTRNDDIWTFGTPDKERYLTLAGIRVHRIVAAAFLGPKPSPKLVIDHKDSIRVNNRPENLHYVTRFENLVNNPNTRTKLERATGMTIEELLAKPDILHHINLPQNLSWLRGGLSREEIAVVKKKLEIKALHNRVQRIPDINDGSSKTKYAFQADGWVPAGCFPCCPQHERASLEEYMDNLSIGGIIFYHEHREYPIIGYAMSDDGKTLAVKVYDELAVKKHILITITYDGHYWFTHKCDRFFEEIGLEKYYTIALGKEWLGCNVLDDNC